VPFLSELTGKTVADVNGERIGRLDDLVAVPRHNLPHPQVTAIIVKRAGGQLVIPLADVVVLLAPAVALNKRVQDIVPYAPGDHDLYLVRDVLDKQIIDTDGVRVVRVNDLELARVNGAFYVANVDIGGLGLMRRLGLGKPAEKVASRLGRKSSPGVISWEAVELLSGDQPMRLRVPSEKIAELHPADLAEIISDLGRVESGKLLDSLDVETVADTLEEVEPEFQASLVESMPDERVADVLEEMAPDEAADLLAELPEERSQDLLNLMAQSEADDVRKLLTYPVDSAGGIMTTEFVAVRADLTAEQVIAYLRRTAQELETINYIYVTDRDERLTGVFSLQDLVLAHPRTPVARFMHERVVTLVPTDSQDQAAQAIAKYNLLAIPVVDEEGKIHGIVTADDALDKIIPTAWKKRLPRMYR
jgi:CBS domain-containing protein